jgi:hypothetical protein
MAVRRIGAEALLELALAEIRSVIGPSLPAEQQPSLAGIIRAIEIARREIMTDTESPLWALLDQLYEPGEGSVGQLAADIRSGKVSEARNPGLGRHLVALLEAELAVSDPGVLPRGGRVGRPAATQR